MKYLALKPEWWPALSKVPVAQLRGLLKAMLDYATVDDPSGVGSNLTGMAAGVFLALAADIEGARRASASHAARGRIGGEASGSKRKQKKATPSSASSCFANQNQNQDKSFLDESSTPARGRAKKSPPSLDLFIQRGKLAGVPENFARAFYNTLAAADWRDAEGRHISNPVRYLKSAWTAEQKKISAARDYSGFASLDDIPIAR